MSKLLQFIVSRMNGQKYGAPEFYWWVKENLPEEDAEPILNAIDAGDECKVKEAIFEHFDRHKLYPLALAYVRAVKWLDDDPEQSREIISITQDFWRRICSLMPGRSYGRKEYL